MDTGPDQPTAAPPDTGPTPGEKKNAALVLLGKHPPLPPAPSDDKWDWTAARLKAIYLDGFTDLSKAEIADLAGVSPRGFYKWRQHPDYKRYLAELVFSDGLADRVERAKTRKGIASKLAEKILSRLDTPGDNLNTEKLPALIKALEELLGGLRDDSATWEKKTIGAALVGDTEPRRAGLDLVNRINAIEDPAERATVKKHLLSVFREYIGAERDAPLAGANGTEKGSSVLDSRVSSVLDAETVSGDENTAGENETPGDLDSFEMDPPSDAAAPDTGTRAGGTV